MADETDINELEPPPGAYDSEAQEILRTWVTADGGLEVGLVSAFEEPGVWGVLLADLARHAARAYEQEGRATYDDALAEIKELFDAEWQRPTDPGRTDPSRNN